MTAISNAPIHLQKAQLKKSFTVALDLIAKASIAETLWKSYAMTFNEVDTFLEMYEGWCCCNIWMARLSDTLKRLVRNKTMASSVAKILSFLAHDEQDAMVGFISASHLKLKCCTGIHRLAVHHYPDYLERVRIQNNISRGTVAMSRQAQMKAPVHSGEVIASLHPQKKPRQRIFPDEIVAFFGRVEEVLEGIERLPLDQLVTAAKDPYEILEWKKKVDEIGEMAIRIHAQFREAWKKKLVEVSRGTIIPD